MRPTAWRQQSHRNPDGSGIGVFGPDGTPLVAKQPIAAWDDIAFATEARELTGTTFVAHVRHASTGAHTLANTHPFEQRGRLFAHNGVVRGPRPARRRLAELGVADLVLGETDSERMFALITAEIAAHGDDVGAGVPPRSAGSPSICPSTPPTSSWRPPTDLWALRYPAANELWLLPRRGRRHGRSGRP